MLKANYFCAIQRLPQFGVSSFGTLLITMPAGKKIASASSTAPARKTAKGYKRPVELPSGTEINSGGSTSSSSSHKQNWIVGQLIGHGGFGDVYVTDISRSKLSSTKSQYVVKVEPKDNGPLFVESKFFKTVAAEKQISDFKRQNNLGHVGIPIYYDSGVFDYKTAALRYLVIQRLGSGLDVEMRKLHSSGQRDRLPIALLFELAVQLIDALHYIHSHGYTHGDIKENNIMLGWPKSDSAYLIDFGLTSRFIFEGKHREYRENPKAAHDGTLEFTSLDSHKGVSGSRRSDLQILGFCLTKLLYGQLPWSGVEQPPVVMEQKIKYLAKPDSLLRDAAGKNSDVEHCKELENYWKLVAKLKYEEEPDYSKLRTLFLPRSSRGLFSVAKNFAKSPAAASSTSKRHSESSSPPKEQPKVMRKAPARARVPSAASTSSSKRSKSTDSNTSEEDLDTPQKPQLPATSSVSTRAARAAKRLKLHSISESADDSKKAELSKGREAKQSGASKPSKTDKNARRRINPVKNSSDSDENDTDGVFEAEIDDDDDEIQVVSSSKPVQKKLSTSSARGSSRARKTSPPPDDAKNNRGKPVLLLPVNISPKKKCLKYFDAEVYAIPPVPSSRGRANSVQPTSVASKRSAADGDDAVDATKNPFSLAKFAESSGSSDQRQTNDHGGEEETKAARLSSSQPASGSSSNAADHSNSNGLRTLHKKLMHFDQEVTIVAGSESDDGFEAPAASGVGAAAKVGRSKRV